MPVLLHDAAPAPLPLDRAPPPRHRAAGRSGEAMRTQAAMALVLVAALTACGMLGKDKPGAPTLDNGGLISKPIGPGLVARCPVPADYDDATLQKIQDALH